MVSIESLSDLHGPARSSKGEMCANEQLQLQFFVMLSSWQPFINEELKKEKTMKNLKLLAVVAALAALAGCISIGSKERGPQGPPGPKGESGGTEKVIVVPEKTY